jgi:translation elongation factor EF-1alpha
MPINGERNITFILNGEICVCKVTITKDLPLIEQIYGTQIGSTVLRVGMSTIEVGDLNE